MGKGKALLGSLDSCVTWLTHTSPGPGLKGTRGTMGFGKVPEWTDFEMCE